MFITVEFKTPFGWTIIREHFEMPGNNLPLVFESIRKDLEDSEAELRVWFERTNPSESVQ